MPRPKKDYKVLSIKLSTPIHDKLELFCEESGLSKTIAVEKLLDRFLDEYFDKPEDDRKIIK